LIQDLAGAFVVEGVHSVAARAEILLVEPLLRVAEVRADDARRLVHAERLVGVLVRGEGEVGGQRLRQQANDGVEQQGDQARLGQEIEPPARRRIAGLLRQQVSRQHQAQQFLALARVRRQTRRPQGRRQPLYVGGPRWVEKR